MKKIRFNYFLSATFFVALALGVVSCSSDDIPSEGATAYITKVLDYMPAVGQFTNVYPQYEEGDTQEIMNQRCLKLSEITKRNDFFGRIRRICSSGIRPYH